jgi:hypothetical protein
MTFQSSSKRIKFKIYKKFKSVLILFEIKNGNALIDKK